MSKLEQWIAEREKLYTSVIPGVMDSTELEDMRTLLAVVRRVWERLDFLFGHHCNCGCHGCVALEEMENMRGQEKLPEPPEPVEVWKEQQLTD